MIISALVCMSTRDIAAQFPGVLVVPAYDVHPASKPTHLLAGVGSVDITPPAGYPMGGHSFAGRFSRGHWLRLRARAFYFRDTTGSSIALVSCDLPAVAAGLHEMVAYELNQPKGNELAVTDISPDNLVLSATHTHQAPGNHHSNNFYNGNASPFPGFDRALFDFLVTRIANAVRSAVRDAEAHSAGATLTVRRGRASDISRNRTIEAFLKNEMSVRKAILATGGDAPPQFQCSNTSTTDPVCIRYKATDATLTVADIERPGEGLVGSMVFFSVHPTVLRHDAAFYSPDFTGWAMTELERGRGQPGYSAAWFNGADGDISPRWEHRDTAEAEDLGRRLADAVLQARSTGSQLDLEGDEMRIRARRSNPERTAFCGGADPEPGAPTLGGAEDGRFVTFDAGWRERERKDPALLPPEPQDPLQGNKLRPLQLATLPLINLTPLIALPLDFPDRVPVSVISLGRLSVVVVPTEMTTAVAHQAREAARTGDEVPVLVGPANEYLEYTTTAAEYRFQDYVGSSTLFGPKTAECYLGLITTLHVQQPLPSSRHIQQSLFRPGAAPPLKIRFGPAYWGISPEYADEELFSPLVRASDFPRDLWPRLEWQSPGADDELSLFRQTPQGTWELVEDDGDRRTEAAKPSSHLVSILLDGTPGRTRWEAIWLPDLPGVLTEDERRVAEGVKHVLAVRTQGSGSVCSVPFSLAELRQGSIPSRLPMSTSPCPH